jgi:RNA polymerase sigma-70 factor (ECF subfamily)
MLVDRPAKDLDQLLAAARTGCGEALGQVLERYRNYLLLIAQRELEPVLQAKGGASDLVQETFFEAQRDFGLFQGGSEEELRAWLRRLLLNNVANFSRRYHTDKRQVKREQPLEAGGSGAPGGGLPQDAPSPSGEAVEREQAAAVQRALERLPEKYRQVLVWRYQEQRSFEEIGRLLECSPKAAHHLWARALRRLEQELKGPS